MLPDVLTLVLANIQHTRSLLNMRRTCRQAWKALSMEHIMGMSLHASRLLFHPVTSSVGIARSPGVPGLTTIRQGATCIMWNTKKEKFIEINQFSNANRKWKRDFSFEVSTPASTYLWSFVSADGLLCTLSAAEASNHPLVFTVLRLSTDGLIMCTTIHRNLLIMPAANSVKPDSLLYASWAGRSFLIILPCNEHSHKVGVLEIDSELERWEWWEVSVVTKDQGQLQMGPMYQIDNFVFIMPLGGTSLFRLDLAMPVPRPQLAYHYMPTLPTHVTAMKVSNDFRRVLAYSPSADLLYSVTQSHAHVLAQERLNSFFFAGDDAAVVFHRDSDAFRVYNLRNNDLVRECRLDHVPNFVSLDDALWTIDASMRVRKLARASDPAETSPASA